jgi:hypothetical protein
MKIILALTALLAVVQDKEDPRFKYWSNCKVGSWVKTKMVIDQGEMKGEMEQTQKLVEVADDKLTIEISGNMKLAGKERPIPPRKQEIKAKDTEGTVQIDKEGDEEIEIAGKMLKCHWYEMTVKAGANPMKMKAWMSSEIPGGGAKVEVTPPNQKTVTMTAAEWEKK